MKPSFHNPRFITNEMQNLIAQFEKFLGLARCKHARCTQNGGDIDIPETLAGREQKTRYPVGEEHRFFDIMGTK